MKDLIAKLEAAQEDEQGELILKALQYAFEHDWIIATRFVLAKMWVRSGAYLSAAMVLVPKGWFCRLDTSGADVQLWHPDKRWEEYRGFAATPALAVAIAALKAGDQVKGDGQ